MSSLVKTVKSFISTTYSTPDYKKTGLLGTPKSAYHWTATSRNDNDLINEYFFLYGTQVPMSHFQARGPL